MITILNQITIKFNIGNYTDFISMEDFHSFEIIENAGGLRPILKLNFEVMCPEIISYINSGNTISMLFGISETENIVYQFQILKDTKIKQLQNGYNVSLMCGLYCPTFCETKKSNTYYSTYSYKVFEQIAADNNFKLETNVTKTQDQQDWSQDGLTDWEFLDYVYYRTFRNTDTFFAYGFDCSCIYLYNIRELLSEGPKWILSVKHKGGGNVVPIGTYQVDDTNSGVCSQLAGKNETIISYNVDTGEFANPSYSLKTFTTMNTNKLNINAENCANYSYQITSGKEHANASVAINQNRRNNILFSSFTCRVPVTGAYYDFKLLDMVQLLPMEVDVEAAGFYIITGISKIYSNYQYYTLLTLNRESANALRGDNLVTGEY